MSATHPGVGVLRIATRGSELALWQANFVKASLERHGHVGELVLVETQGDRDGRPFGEMVGQGFFTKAVQDALLDGRADIAVHSHKDLPSAPTPGLEVAAVPGRADPRDVLLVRRDAYAPGGSANSGRTRASASPRTGPRDIPLPHGATVGTSAARRRQQLLAKRPDLAVEELRGNVPTRVETLRGGRYDAIVLAAAGIDRLALDLGDLEVVVLDPEVLVPAPAQGALALETRRDAYAVAAVLTDLHDPHAYRTVAAERGLMAMLHGGCQLALGAHAVLHDGGVRLRAWFEGAACVVEHPTAEGAAMLAYDALGRPSPARREDDPSAEEGA